MSSFNLVIFIYKCLNTMKNQICTILGGGGFIGRYLVRNLTKKNYRCIISTRKAFQKGYLKTQATPGAIELLIGTQIIF